MLYPLLAFSFLISLLFTFKSISKSYPISSPNKSYPLIGNYLSIYANRHRLTAWTSDLVHNSPTSTVVLSRPFRPTRVITGSPTVVEHILKSNFPTYQKGEISHTVLFDFLGDGIFNVDGDQWKSQRQLYSHVFSTKSLRYFVEHVVDTELNERLIPMLATAAANDTVVDLQDILQRFALDNICKIAFDYDPACLTPSFPLAEFSVAFDEALILSTKRYHTITPLIWKIKRFLNKGSEKRLKEAKSEVTEFTKKVLNEHPSNDLLSRFINSGYSNENYLMDIINSFIFAGRDTTSAALTWFFWLLFKNPTVENKIIEEINEKSDSPTYDELKDMVYTHASLCETMRLYPPVPVDSRTAVDDDVLPDGTIVKKGMVVSYHIYAMGRMEKLWGKDWMEFRPERWFEKDEKTKNVRFKARDPYTYTVFQAGPRICLGKDMSFLQMKRVVAGVLRQFKVVPVVADGSEPAIVTAMTSKMIGGFPVKIKKRKC
ncbi:cytochrome P450 94A1-like [Bidens hawaiensis]|uniref:cytochrome P450 94A1-like n=1 Tax=Bidens hawaiensis TaxID=980011 RepID=UPI00404B1B16